MSHRHRRRKWKVRIILEKPYPSRHNELWTEEEMASLKSMYQKGLSIPEIASKLHRRTDSIAHKLLNTEVIGYPNDIMPPRYHAEWSIAERNRLRNEVKKNKSLKQIADIHQRTRNAILHQMIQLRLFDIEDRSILDKYKEGRTDKLKDRIQDLKAKYPYAEPIINVLLFFVKR